MLRERKNIEDFEVPSLMSLLASTFLFWFYFYVSSQYE